MWSLHLHLHCSEPTHVYRICTDTLSDWENAQVIQCAHHDSPALSEPKKVSAKLATCMMSVSTAAHELRLNAILIAVVVWSNTVPP